MSECGGGDQGYDMRKLRWQCRRGMLELDLLLEGFLDDGYAQLTPAEQQAFRDLLDQADPDLLEWLMGRQAPADLRLADVVARIRSRPAS